MFHSLRRGGRVVECGGLENRLSGVPGYEGSNPSSSASCTFQASPCGSFFFINRKGSAQQGLRCSSRGRRWAWAAACCASPPRLSRRHIARTQQPQRAPRASAAPPASRRTGLSAFPATLPLRQRSAGAARWKPAGSATSGRAHPMPRRAECNPISHTAAAA